MAEAGQLQLGIGYNEIIKEAQIYNSTRVAAESSRFEWSHGRKIGDIPDALLMRCAATLLKVANIFVLCTTTSNEELVFLVPSNR